MKIPLYVSNMEFRNTIVVYIPEHMLSSYMAQRRSWNSEMITQLIFVEEII